METGLFEIQASHLRDFRQGRQVHPASRDIVYAMFGRPDSAGFDRDPVPYGITNATQSAPNSAPTSAKPTVDPAGELARCFLHLANLPNYALDRLSRYEATLWRQVGQILFALDSLDRRKSQHRRSHYRIGSR
jgi:hypothetical protein